MANKKNKLTQLNYVDGDLNLPFKQQIRYSTNTRNQNPISINNNMAREANARDITGPFLGRVVRVEPDVETNNSTTSETLHAYKIFVPILDVVPNPDFCLPRNFTEEKYHKIHEKIDRLRTYIQRNPDIPAAKEGQLVQVTFGNNNFQDPIYLGPIYNDVPAPEFDVVPDASSAFKNLAKSKKRK
jgi:hypothetical protein